MNVLRGVAAVVLALGAVSGASAATTNGNGSSPSAAISLSPTAAGTLTASGSVAGATTGGFEYYTFNYPGNGATGTLTMTFTPTDPVTANGVGVDLWQNGAEIASMNGSAGSTAGTNSVSFTSATAGPVLVQVYNYDPGVTANFQLSLTGLPAAMPSSSTTPAPTAVPSSSASSGSSTMFSGAGTASSPFALTKPMSGTLTGSTAGAFAYFTVPYPGDGSTHTVTLNFSPSDLDTSNGVFVTVYQSGTVIGSSQGSNNGGTPGVLSVPFGSTVNAPAVIQLANYNPGVTISYTISP